MKLADVMKQDTVTLTAGDYLVANTDSVGYLPTHKNTSNLHLGRYLFRVVANGDLLDVVPVYEQKDGSGYWEDTANPIVSVGTGLIKYVTTRNSEDFRDVYHATSTHTVDSIPTGQEARHALAAFIAFAASEYSLGVNHFQLEGADYLNPAE
jgi:hypothetical protein